MPPDSHSPKRRPALGRAIAGASLVLLTACTLPGPDEVSRDGIFDPYEARNRKVHESSKRLDREVLRPVALAYAENVPDTAQILIGNFADNLSVPGAVVNQLLQVDLQGALHNTVRFGVNSTLGFGGIFDVAADFGIEEDDSDFGATLAVWGVPEGAYLELPVIGPSTERDAIGVAVDLVLDPLNAIARPHSYYLKGARIVARVGKRGRFASNVDSILYASADSYAQTRLLYLQNRRFELDQAGAGGDGGEIDPYSELYDDEIDPYSELYGVE